MIKCVQCKDDYKVESNIIKMGIYWAEVYNTDPNGWNLCRWCEFSLNERSNNG